MSRAVVARKIHKVTKQWTTGDGSKIRICDMTDDHLRNAIALLERKHEEAKLNCPYPTFNSDMAQMYAEQDWERLQESDPEDLFPLYLDLCEEAHRRGLLR